MFFVSLRPEAEASLLRAASASPAVMPLWQMIAGQIGRRPDQGVPISVADYLPSLLGLVPDTLFVVASASVPGIDGIPCIVIYYTVFEASAKIVVYHIDVH